MSRTSLHRKATASGAIAVLLLTACGGSGQGAPAQSPQGAPASAPASDESGVVNEQSAPAAEEESRGAAAPAPAAPSGAALPRSTKAEQRPGESDEIDALGRKLEGALRLSVPDCTTAWSLRDRICDLADRICDLASRSNERDVAERCTDAKSRCERATSRVREACGR